MSEPIEIDAQRWGRFYRDEQGMVRAELGAPYQALGWFLEQDVQSSLCRCDELIASVDRAGAQPYESTGNAHTVTIHAGGALVETHYAEPRTSCAVSLAELRSALQQWRDLISVAGASKRDDAR